jgi:probable rRNA maturation factor
VSVYRTRYERRFEHIPYNILRSLFITNKTTKRIPRALLERVFCFVGKRHTMEISLVFLGDRASRVLHKRWHNKDEPANVLSFLLDAAVGEIVINPYQADREAKEFHVSCTKRVVYLFVHGLLHLYGYDHTTKKKAQEMEKKEREIIKHFSI